MSERLYFHCAFGPIDVADRTLNGCRIPDDTWRRAFRMQIRGFIACAYTYIGDWWAFNKQMGRI